MQAGVVDEKYLTLTRELSLLQEELAQTLPKLEGSMPMTEGVLILNQPPVIRPDEYRRVFRRILDFLLEKQDQNHQELRGYYSLVEGECSGCLTPLIQAALEVNTGYFAKLAQIRQENANLMHFVAEAAIRPFLRQLAAQTVKGAEQFLEQGVCPVCGEEARIAKIVEEGQRNVTCPRCTFEWRVRRMVCLLCGNDDHQTQSYIEVEGGGSSAKLHVCDACKGYIKEVDTRSGASKGEEASVLDLQTLHLDILAQEKGYGPHKEQH